MTIVNEIKIFHRYVKHLHNHQNVLINEYKNNVKLGGEGRNKEIVTVAVTVIATKKNLTTDSI